MAGVLKLVAEKSGWGKKLPKGIGHGDRRATGAIRATSREVVQVSVSKAGDVRVEKVWVAGDVGHSHHQPERGWQSGGRRERSMASPGAVAQAITFANGRVVQTNFHDYPLLRMNQAPKVEVHFLKTDNPPTGLGEPALPPVVPALANAIFAATGKRVRKLPIDTSELKTASPIWIERRARISWMRALFI